MIHTTKRILIWAELTAEDLLKRLPQKLEEMQGDEVLLSYSVRFRHLQSNFKQQNRLPPQLCNDRTHTDTLVDLISSTPAISKPDNQECTDITLLRAQRNHVDCWTKPSLKFGSDCTTTCRLQLATLGVDGTLNHSIPRAKCSRHYF